MHLYVAGVVCPYCALRASRALRWAREARKAPAGGVVSDPILNLLAEQRPTWDEYYLAGAVWASTRADCRRGTHGCLLVLGNRIVGAGYNGAPPKHPKSCLRGECPRGLKEYGELPGCNSGGGGNHDFKDCIALHAEQNAIGDAAARGVAVRGSTAYITAVPCDMCLKLLVAAGIVRVVTPDLVLSEDHMRGILP